MKKPLTFFALATTVSLSAFSSMWDLNFGPFFLSYEETVGGQTLDKVTGSFPLWNVIFDARQGCFFFEGQLGYAFGSGKYSHHTDPSFTSANSYTDHQFFFSQAMLGWGGAYMWGTEWMPVIAVGRRVWIREVPSVHSITDLQLNSYTETYTNNYAALGLRASQRFYCAEWRSTLLLGSTLAPHLRASIPIDQGGTIFFSESLGTRFWCSWELFVTFAMPVGAITVGGQVQAFRFGQSSTFLEIDEPNSSTVQGDLTVGWQTCF